MAGALPTTMSDTITIRDIGHTYLHCHYRGQTATQPCFVALNCQTGDLTAAYNPEVGDAVPMDVWNGHTLRWCIPALRGPAANVLLKSLVPYAEKIVAGYDRHWDGQNYIATYAGAENAIATIGYLCDSTYGGDNVITVVDAEEWFQAGLRLGDADMARSLRIRGTDPDEVLAAIAGQNQQEALSSGFDILKGLYDYLERLRKAA